MKLSTKKFVILSILSILSQVQVSLAEHHFKNKLPNLVDFHKFQNQYDSLVAKLSEDYICRQAYYEQTEHLIYYKLEHISESLLLAADRAGQSSPIYLEYYQLMNEYAELRNKFARKCNKKEKDNEFVLFIEPPQFKPIDVVNFVTITSTPNPVTTTSIPVTSTSTPVTTTSIPVTTTSAPVTTTLVPVTTTSAPVTTTSIPVTTTSAPVTTTTVSVTTTSAPVTTTSIPVTSTSVPVTTTSIPVTSTSTPVIPISSQNTPRNLYNPHKTQHNDNRPTIDKIRSSPILGWLAFVAMNAMFFGAINMCIVCQKKNYLRTVANRPDEFELIQV